MKIGILSDIHEDSLRLDLALKKMENAGVDHVACLGDIAGFDVRAYNYLSTRNASHCLDMIRANCRWVIAGNHDLFAIRKTPDVCVPFSFPPDWYTLDFQKRQAIADHKVWLFEDHELSALLSMEDREYIDSLPFFIRLDLDGIGVMLSHSIYPDVSGSLTMRPKNHWDFRQHFQWMKEQNASIGFSGHLHLNGLGAASSGSYELLKFGSVRLSDSPAHFICPCTASSAGKNGFLVLDTLNRTLKAFSLGSRRYLINFFR